MRIYLQTPAIENQAPKYYHLHLEPDMFEGWLLTKEWGYQGSSGRIQKKHYTSVEEAEKALMESRDSQIKKGYRVVFVQGQINNNE